MRFEPATNEFCLKAQTDWAIRSWVQLGLRAKLIQLLQFHLFFQCSHYCLCQLVAEWIVTNVYVVFTNKPLKHWFRSDALTDSAIMPWVQLALRANFAHTHVCNIYMQSKRKFIYVYVCDPSLCGRTYFSTNWHIFLNSNESCKTFLNLPRNFKITTFFKVFLWLSQY